ncbi:hypothetical protein PFUGPA_00683 [Plasmodium falciparum Palo Alto/Uganda]|uniref:Plasmodium falciparum erythrocyte membrane protein 1 acidic terminal segment domain-containing protein n=1 Tax=Plasmodium falciparum (isolate Palo Alto / Uganda) TaxID=57270 RepID=W4J6E9_PLAFP|nr:hypothetical protein PFUGPA_00683 [Plasmodium falciparum Palo Alto/Uganda]
MCEQWNNKEDILNKLNEQWNKEKDGGNVPSDNRSLNTNVSFEIDMDENKGKKEFRNMDTILDNIEDDIYYDVNDENPSVYDISMDHNKVDVPKKVHVEMKILNNTSNGSLEQEFPISDAAARYAASKGAAEGAVAGNAKGMQIVIGVLKSFGVEDVCPEIFKSILNMSRYTDVTNFGGAIFAEKSQACSTAAASQANAAMCTKFNIAFGLSDAKGNPIGAPGEGPIVQLLNRLAGKAKTTANAEAANVSSKITTQLRTEQTN